MLDGERPTSTTLIHVRCRMVLTASLLSFVRLARTDTTVIAVNGFAADGNTLVKRIKERLEVRRRVTWSTRFDLPDSSWFFISQPH